MGGHSRRRMGDQMGRRYDGTNEVEVHDWFRSTIGIYSTPDADNFLAGVMSEAENATIAAGLNDIVMDYFADAADRDGSTEMLFRSGATKTIQPGSWIVNCTGYLVPDSNLPYEPYVSAAGGGLHPAAVVDSASACLPGLLPPPSVPRYAERPPALRTRWARAAGSHPTRHPYTLFTLVQHNLSFIYDKVPSRVIRENGLDIDTWYPLPRRLPGLPFMLTHRRDRERARRVLDTVRERFDIRCGPLDLGAGMGADPIKQ